MNYIDIDIISRATFFVRYCFCNVLIVNCNRVVCGSKCHIFRTDTLSTPYQRPYNAHMTPTPEGGELYRY